MQETRNLVFDEKLYPSLAFLLTIQVLPIAFWLICLPLWREEAAFVGVLTEVLLVVGAMILAPRIAFDGHTLSVGRARIDRSAIGEVTVFKGSEAQRARTTDLNPGAYLKLRPGIGSYLKVILKDPTDPTPYWLFSTRNPEKLAKALRG
jgi:hypothetical protein